MRRTSGGRAGAAEPGGAPERGCAEPASSASVSRGVATMACLTEGTVVSARTAVRNTAAARSACSQSWSDVPSIVEDAPGTSWHVAGDA